MTSMSSPTFQKFSPQQQKVALMHVISMLSASMHKVSAACVNDEKNYNFNTPGVIEWKRGHWYQLEIGQNIGQ